MIRLIIILWCIWFSSMARAEENSRLTREQAFSLCSSHPYTGSFSATHTAIDRCVNDLLTGKPAVDNAGVPVKR